MGHGHHDQVSAITAPGLTATCGNPDPEMRMPFIRSDSIKGKIFVPTVNPDRKKHPCRDCFSCQKCADTRCRMCLCQKYPEAQPAEPSRDTEKG